MIRILCYGDSNTWGSLPFKDVRYDDSRQWPNLLAEKLGGAKVVQEGLCARTAGDIDKNKPFRNGQEHFEAIFRSAAPLDLVIIALGTNDFKVKYNRSAREIFNDLMWYSDKIDSLQSENEGKKEEIMYLAPAAPDVDVPGLNCDRFIWNELVELLRSSGKKVLIIDDLELGEDGLHYTEAAHVSVATELSNMVKEIV